ncbi:MAG: ABC transporter permease [Microthrixaceae bacterium]|nr:ABC transporter permease [Microthrixaceae bacterium]
MTDLVSYAIRGVPIGCVFALMAVGVVLTYKTSGVFNLAFGAQAFVSAAVYYETRVRHDWPIWLAFLVAVVALGPAIGYVLDRALFRHLRTAPPIARLVTSLGLLVAIPQMVQIWFGNSPAYNPLGIAPDPGRIFRWGEYALDANQVATILVTLLVVAALTVLFRFSALGLRMRAVVESPRMSELTAINADRVGSSAWMMSSFLAGLSGVLLAPLFAQVEANAFFTLLVAAVAAAAFGGLSSIPLTFAGGLALGVLQQVLAGYLPSDSVVSQGLRPALPFLVLFLLLLFWPPLRGIGRAADPLAGVDPPPPAPAATVRSSGMTTMTRVLAVATVAGFVLAALFWFDAFWLLLFTKGLIFGVIFLSITVLTGMGGQVSLSQAAFAGVGAFATGQLVENFGLPVLPTMFLGALVAAVVGAVLAIPALRLDGLYLTLATLAFALMWENVLVPQTWVSSGPLGVDVPRPLVGPVDFTDDRAFLLLCLVVLALVGLLVLLVKRGTTGRYLDALRGSELAAASIGVDRTRARITTFALSAGIAGLGGGLLASQVGRATPTDYVFFLGLFWVVMVVTLGDRSVQAAITAGMSFLLVPELLSRIDLGFLPEILNPADNPAAIASILFGLGALTYAKHPEGILELQTRRSIERVNTWGAALARRRSATVDASDGPDPAVANGPGGPR